MIIQQVMLLTLIVISAGYQIGLATNPIDSQEQVEKNSDLNQTLVDRLKKMAEQDQIAAYIPQGKYKEMSKEEWNSFKDGVFRSNCRELKKIFNEYGYPGYNLVGKKGESNFWVMVQHCDFDVEFQKKVLAKLESEVLAKNADGRHFALLTDRVKINSGEQQIYGTQFAYNEFGQAYAKNLFDSENVDDRRRRIGLGPLLERMNEMTKSHFLINRAVFESKGIKEPKLYPTK